MTAATNTRIPTRPYPGIEPYSFGDRSIFFGREAEARKLMHLIILYKGVMLFGDSGVGKSSLLNAAILPDAVEEDFTPVFIRVRPRDGEELAIQPVEDHTGTRRAILTVPDVEETTLSCDEMLAGLRNPQVLTDEHYPLLVFDQLEELVTLFGEPTGASPDGRDSFAVQQRIVDLVHTLLMDDTLRVKIVLSFREDYLAKLRNWFSDIPYFDEHYLRVESLDAEVDTLRRVIRRPFEVHPGTFRNELSESLAIGIAQDFAERSGGRRVGLSELQVVCRALWESGDAEAMFARLGSSRIIEEYFTAALHSLPVRLQAAAVEILSRLVTSSGTRNIVSRDDLIAQAASVGGFSEPTVRDALDALHESARLVSREQRRGVEFYEVVSEHIIPWIIEQTRDRVDPEEANEVRQELLESVRHETGRYLRLAAGWRRGTIVAGVLILAGIMAMGIADAQTPDTDDNEWIAIVGGSLLFIIGPAVAVIGVWRSRVARRRARSAESLLEEAQIFLDGRNLRSREEISDVRSEFRQRYVPLPVDRHLQPIPTVSSTTLSGSDPFDPPVAVLPADMRDAYTGYAAIEVNDAKQELLDGAQAEVDRHVRQAILWRRWSLVLGALSIAMCIASGSVAGEDFEDEPWGTIFVVFFYVTLVVVIVWFVFGRRAQRRAERAPVLYQEAVAFLADRHPSTRAEVRFLRSDFRSRFVPLPVRDEPVPALRGLPAPTVSEGFGASVAVEARSEGDTFRPPDLTTAPAVEPLVNSSAGWLSDPTGRHEHRYWSGTSWTEHVSDGGVASVDPIDETPS